LFVAMTHTSIVALVVLSLLLVGICESAASSKVLKKHQKRARLGIDDNYRKESCHNAHLYWATEVKPGKRDFCAHLNPKAEVFALVDLKAVAQETDKGEKEFPVVTVDEKGVKTPVLDDKKKPKKQSVYPQLDCPSEYVKSDADMNQAMGGSDILMCSKWVKVSDKPDENYITGLSSGSSCEQNVGKDGWEWVTRANWNHDLNDLTKQDSLTEKFNFNLDDHPGGIGDAPKLFVCVKKAAGAASKKILDFFFTMPNFCTKDRYKDAKNFEDVLPPAEWLSQNGYTQVNNLDGTPLNFNEGSRRHTFTWGEKSGYNTISMWAKVQP